MAVYCKPREAIVLFRLLWDNVRGYNMARKTTKRIKIVILSPEKDASFILKTSLPVKSSQIILNGEILENGIKIVSPANWRLILSWGGTYKTYQTTVNISGNPVTTCFSSGGTLRIRISVSIKGKEYFTSTKATIIGQNPTREQLNQVFPNDLLKAIAWQESSWRQFDAKGNPLKNPNSSMVGLMQISERWWGTPRSPIKSNDFNQIAWDWNYNIQTAKEILDYYYQLVTNKYAGETEESRWNRALKAYNAGASTIKTRDSADNFWYVNKIRTLLKEKPWEK